MSYLVLARKYRPVGFDDFVGQEVIAETLRNAIELDRVAHAYLFCGPRGVGKTSMARVFAKALNCVKGPTGDPCGECEHCRRIGIGQDVDVIEIDGASNRGIDEVREIRQNVRYAAADARYKIYYVDEVHMLTEPAFNALLKTLEEPPAHVKFFMATTAPAKLPETILSRVQRFDFRRIATPDIARRLSDICKKEGVNASQEVCLLVARRGRGSMRDAQSLLDQVISFCGTEPGIDAVTSLIGALGDEEMQEIVEMIRRGDTAGLVQCVAELLERGMDAGEVIDEMIQYLRDLLVGRLCGANEDLLDRPAESAAALVERARDLSPDAVLYMIEVLNSARRRLREGQDDRIVLEMALVRMSEARELRPVGELLERVAALEQVLSEGVPAASQPMASQPAPPPPRREPPPSARQNPSPRAEPVNREDDVVRETAAVWDAESGDLDDLWEKLLGAVHEESSWLYLTLAQGQLGGVQDGRVTILLPQGRESARRDLEKHESQNCIERVLARITGQSMRVRLAAAGPEPESAGETPEKTAGGDDMIQEALKKFDGRIIRRG